MTAVVLAAPSWGSNPMVWAVLFAITAIGLVILFTERRPKWTAALIALVVIGLVLYAVPAFAVPCCQTCWEIFPGVWICWPWVG